jgi:hypothetical protein
MKPEDKRLQSMQKVSKEDFSTINPRAIWEAEKRLFFLPIVDHQLQAEAAQYLVSSRLDLSYKYIYDKCRDFDCSDYDFDSVEIPVSYEKQWFAPWVQEVKVFWNRIEYLLDDGDARKHQAFRQSCTSLLAFSSKQRFEHGFDSDFPVSKLESIDDVMAIGHEYEESSPFGVVWLANDESELFSISVPREPHWVFEDEFAYFITDFDLNNPKFLNKKARDQNTVNEINLINGLKVSRGVLNFVEWYCVGEDSVLVNLASEQPYVLESGTKNYASNGLPNLGFLGKLWNLSSMFHPDHKALYLSLLEKSEWLRPILNRENSDVQR